jgi:conjugal transfer pilus assembly protein TrbC
MLRFTLKHALNHAVLGLMLIFAYPAWAEDFEQYANQQAQKEQIASTSFEKEVQQLKTAIQHRQISGDIKHFETWLQTQQSQQIRPATEKHYPNILVFISFSMPKDSLKQWLAQVAQVTQMQGSLVIRGLINNSFKDTAAVLTPLFKEQPGGLLLDPTLFKRYNIEKVPAVVVQDNSTCPVNQSCQEGYTVVYGNTSLLYALNKIASSQTKAASVAAQAIARLKENKHGR